MIDCNKLAALTGAAMLLGELCKIGQTDHKCQVWEPLLTLNASQSGAL